MSTKRGALLLAQWLSPAYPVGAFAYSHGIEAAISQGDIARGCDLHDWLVDLLGYGSGRNDSILIHAAHRSDSDARLAEINNTALAFAASAERRIELCDMGAAFCKVDAAINRTDLITHVYPVALGAAAAREGIAATLTAAMYLHAFAGNLVTASQRLMRLGQTEAQGIVAALAPVCEDIADETTTSTLDDLQSTAFLSDIAAMRHETLSPRIFRT